MDTNIVHVNLRNFPNHWVSYRRLPVPSSIGVMGFWRDLFRNHLETPTKMQRGCSNHTTKNSSGTSASELLMKKMLRTLVPSLNVNVSIKLKLKKPTFNEPREFQPLYTNDTVRYRQNNNWTRNWVILNKNDMPQSYTLLNDNDNVIQRNRHHLMKMDSNFLKIQSDHDMNNDTETQNIQDKT